MFFFKLLKLMLTLIYIFIYILFYFTGLIIFCYKRKHLLMVLLRLEYIVLLIFIILSFFFCLIQFNLYISIIYLVFSVCEGALGLGILVSIVRFYGNDYFQSFVVLRC